ncbi:Guanyl-specific ribonuclease F1-like protein [Hapsidospora chrysogenum ATCC 11550]|uniref:ribonuclease T1 n=1 Tax=Hapsidospora chrysogenum (strain ATCC 11550 / CBS 779.69 / DSM 880 / IAM 14645 / JCM 23072 / IMI 49137) TaxID=857340 RepID=A0A086SXB6_HAPC1|nr:Guanyl-specific ribonuclease F1-like protein [Hapsidospora chrysogenum ATCC 11550]
MQFSLAAVVFLATLARAAPRARIIGRDEPAVCGDQEYTAKQVAAAMEAACTHFQDGTDVNDYPHTYNNYEGFEFKGYDGPFQEFPIIPGGVYDGGSPGPDRVVITEDGCKLAGSITHTGADGNDFVACEGTS